MSKEDRIIGKQIDLVEEITKIMKEQRKRIDEQKPKKTAKDKIKLFIQGKILQVKSFYLERFGEIQSFLVDKLKEEEDENFKFYLCNVRTLLDIYGRVLYLCDQDEIKQMKICLARDLFTVAQKIVESDSNIDTEELRKCYKKIYEFNEPFIEEYMTEVIPRNPDEFTWSMYKDKSSLRFPNLRKMLTDEGRIERFSSRTQQFISVEKLSNIYKTQIYFSDYVHGNPMTIGTHGNEKLWVILKTQEVPSLMVELFDSCVLDKGESEKHKEWIRSIRRNRPSYVKFWKSRRSD